MCTFYIKDKTKLTKKNVYVKKKQKTFSEKKPKTKNISVKKKKKQIGSSIWQFQTLFSVLRNPTGIDLKIRVAKIHKTNGYANKFFIQN